MKTLTFILFSLTVGWSSAYLIKVPTIPTQPRIAPVGWVHIQKLMLPLFENVCESSTNTNIVQLANEFTLDTLNGDYTKTGVVDNLKSLKTSKGFLPKGEIFSEYNKDHIAELKAVFELLYYAKDFNTFYKAAAWARQNINCGLFVDAIYLAIINRRDTEKISVPAPYELIPNYFVDRNVVVKASFLLTGDDVTPSEDVKVEGNSYIIDAKYTAELDDSDDEAKLAYFREDIGLNAYYFMRKLKMSPWLDTTDTELYGERMYQMMKQFAARYDLERYSNDLPELEFTADTTVTSYDPMLIYSNGNEFDRRTFSGVSIDNDDVTFLKTIEVNLPSVVTHLRQAGHNKSQILNHLIELLVTSDKSYETVLRKLLGYHINGNERQCSVLEHYMTAMRDPVFWQINKKIVQLIDNALKVLPTYTRNELYFPGVEVVNVEIKKMMTSFDVFQFDVTDSLKTTNSNTTFQVKIAQPRLNHKPFIIKLNVSSLVTKKSCVKIYLGPKMMPGELAQKKHLFVLLDMFELSLKRGSNVVSRSSEQMASFSDDFISFKTLKKKVEDAEFGLDALPLKTVESQIGYPSRLTLPKGVSKGLPLQIFVFVAPFTKSMIGGSNFMSNLELNTAILSPGYPLDLAIETRQVFGLPNAFVKDIVITHKSESKPEGENGGRPTPSHYFDSSRSDFKKDDYNEMPYKYDIDVNYDDSLLVHGLFGDRPDFTYRKTNNNGYSGNKSQYRKKNDYATKITDYKKIDYSNKGTDKQTETTFRTDIKPEVDIRTSDKDGFVQDDNNISPDHGLLGERPAFTYKNKDTTSYTANKSQYNKKEDYASKRTENKKIDFQDRIDYNKKNENMDSHGDINIPKTKIKNDKILQDDLVISDYLFGDTVDNKYMTDNKQPVHGLLGKTSDDNSVNNDKYQIRKDNYVQKAETKRIDYRKKAFNKKAKIGVLDFSLLEKPEDIKHIIEDSSIDGEKQLKKKVTNFKNVSKIIKETNDRTLFTDDRVDKDNLIRKTIGKDKEITTGSYYIVSDNIHPKETLSDEISKIVNKDINKNIDKHIVPQVSKDKSFTKVIKDDTEEIDIYDQNRISKIINKDINKNKNIKKDVSEETELHKDGFVKTINKDITKSNNTHIIIEDDNVPIEVRDDFVETRATTERTMKRVSVYDFLFNPVNNEDEDRRVYE